MGLTDAGEKSPPRDESPQFIYMLLATHFLVGDASGAEVSVRGSGLSSRRRKARSEKPLP